jgi:hypothetical protein
MNTSNKNTIKFKKNDKFKNLINGKCGEILNYCPKYKLFNVYLVKYDKNDKSNYKCCEEFMKII